MPTERPANARYRVVALEPDERLRTRMTLELAGIAQAPLTDLETLMRELVDGEPTVVLWGASLANAEGLAGVQRVVRTFPEAGVVLLAEELTLPLLQDAVRAGVRDALAIDAGETQLRQAIERVGEMMLSHVNRAMAVAPETLGQVVVAFSTKGGVGKSVIATNLSVVLATNDPGRVALVDADLQFGDVAVLLGIPPVHTTADAAGAIETADEQLMEALLATHDASTLRVLCAPVEPSAGDKITPHEMVSIVRMLRRTYAWVVVDLPPHFDDVVLALIEEADHVLLVASMDIPSIKNLKVGIQTLDLLSLAGGKLKLILNRANARVHLDVSDVERALGVSAQYRVPSDIAIPQAVNRGVPVVLDKPRAPAAQALRAVAESFLRGGEVPVEPQPIPAVPDDESETESETEHKSKRRRWR
jgi:pilus assembly protein CpaE